MWDVLRVEDPQSIIEEGCTTTKSVTILPPSPEKRLPPHSHLPPLLPHLSIGERKPPSGADSASDHSRGLWTESSPSSRWPQRDPRLDDSPI
ncbi:UNVERIFIED_CONTAM: hypothetical protein Slati_3462900 [Sesamum latifolium]|uniref:Uncharacterized protein n=1 Tax=Sesamum latifolium TaxID=2727402 RepID=A0AAW2UJB8_9LAMI